MKLIGDRWNKITRGSKITIKENYSFTGLNGKEAIIKGDYFITGFWANAMGLNRTNPEGESEIFAPSIALKYFFTT